MWNKSKLDELGQDLLKGNPIWMHLCYQPSSVWCCCPIIFFIYWKASYLEQSEIELCTYRAYFIRKVIVCFKLINPHSFPGGVEHITQVKNLKLRCINNFILSHWNKMAKSSVNTVHMQIFNATVLNLRVVEHFK